jgi:cytochrome c peroxidase
MIHLLDTAEGRQAHNLRKYATNETRVKTEILSVVLTGTLWAAQAAGAVALDEPIKPIVAMPKQDRARTEIGRRLFNDSRLSSNASVSCATCHSLDKGGADGRNRSVGFDGRPTAVNTPTVLNAALNFKQFWNGRADSLEAQVESVVVNPVEMGSDWPEVVRRVSHQPEYAALFAAAYRDGVTKANIVNAIATYERTLVTPNARFDRYLLGEASALSDQEKSGYAKFKQYGCVACHQGVNVGGNMFQKFGVMRDYFANRGKASESDMGRFLVTGEESDKYVFKVPSLRNVALTAPYFHDASAKTLDEAVDIMFRYQLGRVASSEDKTAIVKFLCTLTGELQGVPQ